MDAQRQSNIAIVHFAAPPVVGGVEEVIRAHTGAFAELNAPATVVTGVGEAAAMPMAADVIKEPLLDTQHPDILAITDALGQGVVSDAFHDAAAKIKSVLAEVADTYPNIIVHNAMTVHVNIPATVALNELLDEGRIKRCIAWCHDFSWTMTDYQHKLHPGDPWELLRTHRDDVTYATVSQRRQAELAKLFECPEDDIRVVYNGVDRRALLGLDDEATELIDRFNIMASDLFVLMPIRVVKSKNIEYAIRVIRSIKDAGVDARLVVTGPPDPHDRESLDYYAMLRALRDELELQDNVHFVYESGPSVDEPRTISVDVVGALIRACDVMLIASHSEGFGMPILEAGLAGKPVFTSDIPAAREIGGDNVEQFVVSDTPESVAARVLSCVNETPMHRHKRVVRQRFTWRSIVERDVLPLLLG